MKLLTSFTKLITGEGVRISYTYSEVDGDGKLILYVIRCEMQKRIGE